MPYSITKKFGHECGYSCCYRQWRAQSHCRFLHGYALAFDLQIQANVLNEQGWVFDFGGFREIRRFLEEHFDHKLIVARDDPAVDQILLLGQAGLADVRIHAHTGCEAFATLVYHFASPIIREVSKNRATLIAVTVREHPCNAATFYV